MKWVVYLLLLGNAAFFARQYHQMSDAPPPERRAVRPYDHVNRLLLLSEVKSDELRPRTPEPSPSLAAATQPAEQAIRTPSISTTSERSCYSIGPLKNDSQIAAVRSWLLAVGGEPALRVDERRELERYWVYFPPLPSRNEAVQRVERMRGEGIEDVIAVPRGDMENAISLGVFSQRSSLERRLKELRRHGYDPSIMPRYRVEKASWFDVTFDEGEKLTSDELSGRFPGAELREASCASAEIARRRAGS